MKLLNEIFSQQFLMPVIFSVCVGFLAGDFVVGILAYSSVHLVFMLKNR